MMRLLLAAAILAASTGYSQACGRFRQRQANCGSTCTQQAATYQPVRNTVRAVVPAAVYSAPNCTGASCPR